MKELPIGIQSFAEIINGGYVYVDKTEYYHRLISKGKFYFLSRPRRFGKSLLISTLKEIFEGNRALFKGLWIEDKIDWAPRPVIHLDFTQISKRAGTLEEGIRLALKEIAKAHGLECTEHANPGMFKELIQALGKQQKVAILIDEYDKPLIDCIDDIDQVHRNRQTLKDLYSVLKGNDASIAFLLLTGVTKFSQVSIFSDLNNLYDITVGREFATMLGYTQAELTTCFAEHLEELRKATKSSLPDLLGRIKEWYNGYSWDTEHFVYNPFSILNLLRKQLFMDFWFATGTPTFLLKLIRRQGYSVFDFEGRELSLRAFNHFDVPNIEINSLLFQTGYLTLKHISEDDQSVTLGFPNREVANAFSFHLLAEMADKGQEITDSLIRRMGADLKEGQVEGFMQSLVALFADIAYPIHPGGNADIANMEKYYHSIFYLLLRLLGYNIQSEVLTNVGRIDTVITTAEIIYIVEFKLGDAESALAQIKAKQYHQKYLVAGKRIILLGIGFDPATRNVGGYVVKEV